MINQIFDCSLQLFLPSTGRAVIPVNPTLSERLMSLEVQVLVEGKESKTKFHPQVC